MDKFGKPAIDWLLALHRSQSISTGQAIDEGEYGNAF
jgi:hypothetical protein